MRNDDLEALVATWMPKLDQVFSSSSSSLLLCLSAAASLAAALMFCGLSCALFTVG